MAVSMPTKEENEIKPLCDFHLMSCSHFSRKVIHARREYQGAGTLAAPPGIPPIIVIHILHVSIDHQSVFHKTGVLLL